LIIHGEFLRGPAEGLADPFPAILDVSVLSSVGVEKGIGAIVKSHPRSPGNVHRISAIVSGADPV
jgi:hypothetical protein